MTTCTHNLRELAVSAAQRGLAGSPVECTCCVPSLNHPSVS